MPVGPRHTHSGKEARGSGVALNTAERVPGALSEHQQAEIDALRARSGGHPMSRWDVAHTLGLTLDCARNRISALVNKGALEWVAAAVGESGKRVRIVAKQSAKHLPMIGLHPGVGEKRDCTRWGECVIAYTKPGEAHCAPKCPGFQSPTREDRFQEALAQPGRSNWT